MGWVEGRVVENKILKILVNVCSYLPLTSCSTVGIIQNKSKNNDLGFGLTLQLPPKDGLNHLH